MNRIRSLAVVPLVVGAIAAQQTIVVQGGVSAFQQALATARHGDTLLVRAGAYTAAMTDQGVSIVCDQGVSFQGMFTDRLGVRDLPAGRTFVLRGGTIAWIQHGVRDLEVSNCAGNVIIDGLQDLGFYGAAITASRSVALHACQVRWLDVSLSSLALAECAIDSPALDPALRIAQSTVELAGGTVTGGNGHALPAGAAIELQSGDLTIAGDSTTVIAGGNGFPPAPAIQTAGGRIRLEPAVRLQSATAPPITGPAPVTTERIPSVAAPSVAAGQTLTVRVHAEAGSTTATLLGWQVAPVTLPWGTLWVPLESLVLDVGVVPVAEVRTTTVTVPASFPAGGAVMLQAVSVAPGGAFAIGPPTPVVIG